MNQRVTTPPTSTGWSGLFFALLLAPTGTGVSQSIAPIGAMGVVRVEAGLETRPYLAVVGPPPLRFAAAIAPVRRDLPPPTAQKPAPEEKPAAKQTRPEPLVGPSSPPPPPRPPEKKPENRPPSPVPPPPPPILPDDAAVPVRPEDFLPFFRFPEQSSARQADHPPSSATYREE